MKKRYANYHRARKYFRKVMAGIVQGTPSWAEYQGQFYDKYRALAEKDLGVGTWIIASEYGREEVETVKSRVWLQIDWKGEAEPE